ncbi:MAG: cyclodeaminase [Candidatus Competibacteraceae bacterium]|nr:cyclodeaminase [Candidatus Competibacteraceae bacterium]
MSIAVLTESELRRCVAVDPQSIELVAGAFAALARGEALMPPILSLDIAERHGEVDIKTAYIRGFDAFAIKISSGFFNNPRLGLPSLSGMMTLLDSETGRVRAVLLDNGYLTDVRTAAAGAVAARALARADIRVAGVLGAGLQARLQIQALQQVRRFDSLRVWSRDRNRAEGYARDMAPLLGVEVRVADDPEALVRESDLVVTTTPSRQPLVRAEWLHPGLHITAMGSDAAEKNELEPQVLVKADRFVCDRKSQSLRLGEWHHAVEAGVLSPEAAVDELGEIVAASRPGRRRDDEITVCDLTGTGVQDTAIALHAYRTARQRGLGTIIET